MEELIQMLLSYHIENVFAICNFCLLYFEKSDSNKSQIVWWCWKDMDLLWIRQDSILSTCTLFLIGQNHTKQFQGSCFLPQTWAHLHWGICIGSRYSNYREDVEKPETGHYSGTCIFCSVYLKQFLLE